MKNNHLLKPFTANKALLASPRMITKAKGMYFYNENNEPLMDTISGMWCSPLGHGREEISQTLATAHDNLDYSPAFQHAQPLEYALAKKIADLAPKGLNHCFFTDSGSEAVDTALKLALTYHSLNNESSRKVFIGRELGYHGVGFGGISVGGMKHNRKHFNILNHTAHLPHTLNIKESAFSKGQPEKNGVELANRLESLIELHYDKNIAAVIIEPLSGSAGVIIPPKGYLQRIREICDKHNILLIFDEVITGFGRLGKPFASEYFGVVPDMITCAKALTNGAFPMGAVIMSDKIYNTIIEKADTPIEFFHGYTYSGHPIACATALTCLEIYEKEKLFERVTELAPYFEEKIHSLKDCKNVIDIRNIGLVGAVELAPSAEGIGKRGNEVMLEALKLGLLLRISGDIIAIAPPFIIEKSEIDTLFETLKTVLNKVA